MQTQSTRGAVQDQARPEQKVPKAEKEMTSDAARWVSTGLQVDMPNGEMTGVQIGDLNVAIYSVAGKIYATDNICTHAYALLTDGWLDEEFVECPLHGGRFDVVTGKAQGDPVTCNLKTFPVRSENGIIEIYI